MESTKTKLLITGCPQGGTTYMATVLSKLNIGECGHERVFTAHDRKPGWADARGVPLDMEVSWWGAKYLKGIEDGVVVLHQTRNPLLQMRSVLERGVPNNRSHVWDSFPGLRKYQPEKRITRVCKRSREVFLNYGVAFYYFWNRSIDSSGKIRFRYSVEDVSVDLVKRILSAIDEEVPDYLIEDALFTTPDHCNTNFHDKEPPVVEWEDIEDCDYFPYLKSMAQEYGYLN